MDIRTYNFKIPSSVARLGDVGVEWVFNLGFCQIVDKHDINHYTDSRYPNHRKRAKALSRLVTSSDLDAVNDIIRSARTNGITRENIVSVRASISRGMCTVRYS